MGGSSVKVALYNQHWSTLGGGEQLAGGLALALGQDADVELLVEEEFDADVASERLGMDLTSLAQRVIPIGTRQFLDATAHYDLLVNTSYTNFHPNGARRGIYYAHFPMPFPARARLDRVRETLYTDLHGSSIERHAGFWLPEFPGQGTWTKGDARMDLIVPRDVVVAFSFRMDAHAWPVGRVPAVRVTVDDREVFSGRLDPRRAVRLQATIVGRGPADPVPVRITSDSFVPRLVMGSDDDRELGVVVSHARFVGGWRRLLHRVVRPGGTTGDFAAFLDSYQLVLANSEYTADWVARLWGRPARVLSPPVLMRSPGTKRPLILAVGRFFPSSSGHSKKQVELVHAFRLACERGLRGWELHVVGGCKPHERRYVEDVRRAAVGLPVKLHVNARGDDVDELFARASLFWHGAGLGENRDQHPERHEHFGITVVEAMSAGAVPLVYCHGGPSSIVRSNDCGRVFSTVEELATTTVALVSDPAELARLRARAQESASQFSFDCFADRARALVASVVSGPVPTRP